MRTVDLCGLKFGLLTVISLAEKKKGKASMWVCMCDCGKQTIVRVDHLNSGDVRSCGCAWTKEIRPGIKIMIQNGRRTKKSKTSVIEMLKRIGL